MIKLFYLSLLGQTDLEAISEAIKMISEGWQSGGWMPAVAALLFVAVKLFRLDMVQKLLPSKVRWESLPKWGRYLLVFTMAAGASVLTGILSGVGATQIAIGAVVAGLGALGIRQGEKAVRRKLSPTTGGIKVPFPEEIAKKGREGKL